MILSKSQPDTVSASFAKRLLLSWDEVPVFPELDGKSAPAPCPQRNVLWSPDKGLKWGERAPMKGIHEDDFLLGVFWYCDYETEDRQQGQIVVQQSADLPALLQED
jgi:hypothetical protein